MTADLNKKIIPEISPTVGINSLAQLKMQAGIKVYNLSAGEPRLSPHKIVAKAAIDAIKQAKTFYPPVSGIPELRTLAAKWLNNFYGCKFQAENCLVVNGGKFGIYLSLQLMLNKNDEVIIASPYWVSYPAITAIFGGIPILVATLPSEGWKLTPENLKKAYSPKTKMLIINNGANPTGALYSEHELKEILKFAKQHNLIVISDEVYSGLTYDDHNYTSMGSFTEYQDNVIIIQSCSKNFSMTGWRVGFVFANQTIINRLTSLMSQSTSGVTTISQWAALAVLKAPSIVNDWVRHIMQQRRNVIIAELNHQFHLAIQAPPSSLYVFIALRDLGVKNTNSVAFCQRVLEDANVALVPGSAFGKEGYIRLSFGEEEEDLKLGIKALAEYLKK